jgi:hypothetical protein
MRAKSWRRIKMTGYLIKAGYNSSHSNDMVEEKLKEVAHKVRQDTEALVQETIKTYGPKEQAIKDHAQKYIDMDDLTLFFSGPDEERKKEEFKVHQFASGYGEQRTIKEHMRRAFCRLVLFEMHKLDMDVNIEVD